MVAQARPDPLLEHRQVAQLQSAAPAYLELARRPKSQSILHVVRVDCQNMHHMQIHTENVQYAK